MKKTTSLYSNRTVSWMITPLSLLTEYINQIIASMISQFLKGF